MDRHILQLQLPRCFRCGNESNMAIECPPSIRIILSLKPASIGEVLVLCLMCRGCRRDSCRTNIRAPCYCKATPLQRRAFIIHHHPSKPMNQSSYIIRIYMSIRQNYRNTKVVKSGHGLCLPSRNLHNR